MLPGKVYKPEDILKILRKRFWLLVVPPALLGAIAAVVVRAMPDRFTATTTMIVTPQQVPESLLPAARSIQLEDRLNTISAQVLTRQRLEQIITDQQLYLRERQRGELMQDLVDRMRDEDIYIARAGRADDAFFVSFTGENPRAVQEVANKLAGLFIDRNTLERSTSVEQTAQFFDTELEEVARQLRQAEANRESFRKMYSGRTPDALNSNQGALAGTQDQLRMQQDTVVRNELRKIEIERRIGELEAQLKAPLEPALQATPPPGGGTTEQQLAAARAHLTRLQAGGMLDAHPDMIRHKRLVKDLEKKAQDEALRTPVSQAVPMRPEDADRQRNLEAQKAQLAALDIEITRGREEVKRLLALANDLQSRIAGTPALESQWTELNRQYNFLTAQYDNLLASNAKAKMSANAERRQIGETFRTLETARLPNRPVSPDRPFWTFAGVAAGLAMGLAIIGLIEYRDSSFKTDAEVTRLLALPVLAVVPMMQSAADASRSRRRKWLVGVCCSTTVMASLAVLAYTFIR